MRLTSLPLARASLALAFTVAPIAALAQSTAAKSAVTKEAATKATPPKSTAATRPISIHDVVGRWAMQVMLTSGDSTLVTHEMNVTPDLSGWTITFPGRAPIPVRVVTMAGDSIVTAVGPYESVLRSGGVQVTTRGVYRMRRGRLVGTTVAHYATTRPDSVLRVRVVGKRIP
jgi:hypothetical protein